ncbi:MAG: Hsp20/alpha crystallin family protein [Deltaproteobacteria bacterium]|nr:Hsp20/alpha crystallin family protein [Deltaproteobacteria bacterium]
MNDKQMVNKGNGSLEKVAPVVPGKHFIPAIDIYETDDELVLLADLPGVEDQGLQLEVARGVLTLAAEAAVEGAGEAAYYRQFRLSDRIDTDAGEATLKDGVLTLRLPKRAIALRNRKRSR